MVNQWGRDGNFGSGSAGSSRSAGSIIIPALIALIIGAGGGYAGARFLNTSSADEVASLKQQLSDIDQQRAKYKTENQNSVNERTLLRKQVKDLQTQVQTLKRVSADQQGMKADSDAQAEIAALKKTIEQAGDLSAQLNRAKRSMKVSELQIIELEKTVSDQKSQIAALQAKIRQNDDEVDPAITLLQAQKQELEAQLADAKNQIADVPDLKSRITALEEQLSRDSNDASDAAKQEIESLRAQKAALQTKLDAALKSAGEVDQQADRMTELQKQLDEMAESLADRDEAARDATRDLKQAKADLDKSKAQLKTLKDQNKALTDAQDDLRKQVVSLNATITSLRAAPAADDEPAANDTGNDNDQDNAGLTPRDRNDVEKAVEDLPGYDNLSADKRETLVTMLEKGECVTDSLKAAYGHVSPISLRSLFRDLGGRC